LRDCFTRVPHRYFFLSFLLYSNIVIVFGPAYAWVRKTRQTTQTPQNRAGILAPTDADDPPEHRPGVGILTSSLKPQLAVLDPIPFGQCLAQPLLEPRRPGAVLFQHLSQIVRKRRAEEHALRRVRP
jgi:hypothetical protein